MAVDQPLGTSTPVRFSDTPAILSPLKMKIRIGKNNFGTAIVGHGAASSVLNEPVPVLDSVTESREGFHGFADSEVPRFVFNDFSSVDLKTPFKASCSYYAVLLSCLSTVLTVTIFLRLHLKRKKRYGINMSTVLVQAHNLRVDQ
jgi:hypothetical protein